MIGDDWDFAHTARARADRAAKATRLADVIDDFGRIPDAAQRRQLLRQAGLHSASDETWSMAVEIYLERHPEPRLLRRFHGLAAIVWLALGILVVAVPPMSFLQRSIAFLVFVSIYANVMGHWSSWQAARVEVRQDDAT